MRVARIASLALISGFLVIVLAGCIERMFFYPDSATYTTPAQLGVRAEDVQIVTADGSRLHGWFLPAVGNAKGTVLHLHGNAANVSNHLPLVSWLPARGYNVLMVDYRGFGRSQGKPSLDGIVDDAAAALAYLRTRPDVDCVEADRSRTKHRRRHRAAFARARCERCSAGDHRFGVRELSRHCARCDRGWSAGTGRCANRRRVARARQGSDYRIEVDSHSADLRARKEEIRSSTLSTANSCMPRRPDSQHWSVPDAMHIMALGQPGSWREKLVQAMDAAVL